MKYHYIISIIENKEMQKRKWKWEERYDKPVSKRATIVSFSDFSFLLAVKGNPIKSHDLVVCSLRYWLGITESTSSMATHTKEKDKKAKTKYNKYEGTREKWSHAR